MSHDRSSAIGVRPRLVHAALRRLPRSISPASSAHESAALMLSASVSRPARFTFGALATLVLDQGADPLHVPVRQLVHLARGRRLRPGEEADGLQHPVAGPAGPGSRPLPATSTSLTTEPATSPTGTSPKPHTSSAAPTSNPRRDTQSPEHRLIALVQEIVAPRDCTLEGSLAREGSPAAPGEDPELLVEALGEVGDRQCSRRGGGQLDGEGETVQPGHQGRDRGRGRRHSRSDRGAWSSPLDEEGGGLVRGQRPYRVGRLTRDAEELACHVVSTRDAGAAVSTAATRSAL